MYRIADAYVTVQ